MLFKKKKPNVPLFNKLHITTKKDVITATATAIKDGTEYIAVGYSLRGVLNDLNDNITAHN